MHEHDVSQEYIYKNMNKNINREKYSLVKNTLIPFLYVIYSPIHSRNSRVEAQLFLHNPTWMFIIYPLLKLKYKYNLINIGSINNGFIINTPFY